MRNERTTPNRASRPQQPNLDEQTFERLRRRITEASGIYVMADENSRFVLERRLLPRLRVRGLTSFSEYEGAIDAGELDAVLDLVAVHETYFFREKRQLQTFSEYLLPELAGAARPFRIWSAGCSTGEEAYTIAMLLADHGLLNYSRVELVASDLSRRVIESGERGLYGQSSFRTTDEFYKERYFSDAGQGLWRASDLLRSRVRFEQSNLMNLSRGDNSHAPLSGDGFDVIFCRNVLMYFDEEAAGNTLSAFHSLLKRGGYLLLGHAESLLPFGTPFEAVQFGRELIHRKK
jgi:chemotaxis protein methyltransferase CheR